MSKRARKALGQASLGKPEDVGRGWTKSDACEIWPGPLIRQSTRSGRFIHTKGYEGSGGYVPKIKLFRMKKLIKKA